MPADRALAAHDDFRYLLFLVGKEAAADALMDWDLDEGRMDERAVLQAFAEEIRRGGAPEARLLHALCKAHFATLGPADVRTVSHALRALTKRLTGEDLQAPINKRDWWPATVEKLYAHVQHAACSDEDLRCLLKAAALAGMELGAIESLVATKLQSGHAWYGAWPKPR